MLQFLSRLLFPPKCHFCRKLLADNETDLCHQCRVTAPRFHRAKRNIQLLAHWTAVWYYKGDVRNCIRRFKFYNARNYADFFGRAIAMKLQEDPFGADFDVLTWVPVSRLRRLTRGYDQSELLAQALGNELGITPIPGLIKKRHTKPVQNDGQMYLMPTKVSILNSLQENRCFWWMTLSPPAQLPPNVQRHCW